jgi:hypothetical protein
MAAVSGLRAGGVRGATRFVVAVVRLSLLPRFSVSSFPVADVGRTLFL